MHRNPSIESYDSKQFGTSLQNLNPERIVSIHWVKSERDAVDIKFYFFKSFEEILSYFGAFEKPLVLATINDEAYTKENAILQFEDNNLNIKVTFWQHDAKVIQLYRADVYQALKQTLSQNSIPWAIYSRNF